MKNAHGIHSDIMPLSGADCEAELLLLEHDADSGKYRYYYCKCGHH